MSAPESLELIRETVEHRLGAYVIRPCERSGFRVVRRSSTGEVHVAFTLTRDAAEEVLMVKLSAMARR